MKSYSICQANKRHGSDYWYGRINDDGEVKYISLKTKRKSEAQEWLAMMNARRFLPEERDGWKKRDIFAAMTAFLQSVETSKGAGSSTCGAYTGRLAVLKDFCKAARIATLGDFTRERAQGFADFLAGRRYAPKTTRELLRCASQFFAWASDTYEIEGWEPLAKVARPKLVKRQKDFWTPEEIDRILDAAPSPRFRLFWAFMAFAGLRHHEACAIGPESVKDGKIEVIGKGNKQAFLPVNDRLRDEMARYGRIEPGLFQASEFRLGGNANRVLKKAVEAASIKSGGVASNHRFRHSFASNLIRAGVNVKAVQQLMRHENVQITLDTYSHLLQEDLTEAANSVG